MSQNIRHHRPRYCNGGDSSVSVCLIVILFFSVCHHEYGWGCMTGSLTDWLYTTDQKAKLRGAGGSKNKKHPYYNWAHWRKSMRTCMRVAFLSHTRTHASIVFVFHHIIRTVLLLLPLFTDFTLLQCSLLTGKNGKDRKKFLFCIRKIFFPNYFNDGKYISLNGNNSTIRMIRLWTFP